MPAKRPTLQAGYPNPNSNPHPNLSLTLTLTLILTGYSLLEIKEAGYVEGLKAAGFSLDDVRGAGFVQGVKAAGYSLDEAKAAQHGQRAVRAVPPLGSCASSGRAWWLWAARYSQGG